MTGLPRTNRVTPRDRLSWAPWAGLLAWLAVLLAWGWSGDAHTADSWAYWDMAARIQEGRFFEMAGVRQFQTDMGIAASFPLGLPLLLALCELLVPIGWRIGPLVNVLLVVGSGVLTNRALGAGLNSGAAWGPVLLLGLALWPPFAQEIAAGRSFPFVILLAGLLLVVLRATTTRRALAVGVLLGLTAQVRTDLTAFAGLAAIGLGLLRGDNHRIRLAAVHVAGLAAVLGVFMLGGVLATGAPVTSDNVRTVLSVDAVGFRTYLEAAPPSVFDQPVAWARTRLPNVLGLLSSAWRAVVLLFPTIAILLLMRSRLRPPRPDDAVRDAILPSVQVLTVSALAALSLGILTTGYFDLRYWTLATFLALLGLVIVPPRRLQTALLGRSRLLLSAVVVVHAGFYGLSGQAVDVSRVLDDGRVAFVERLDETGRRAIPDDLTTCVGPNDRVLLAEIGASSELAARTGVPTAVAPFGFLSADEATQAEQAAAFGFTHALEFEDELAGLELPRSATPCRGLSRLERPS